MVLIIEIILLILILPSKVLTYLGEEMEEDEETMADYDIQVGWSRGSTPWSQNVSFFRTAPRFCSSQSWPADSSAILTGGPLYNPNMIPTGGQFS